MEEEDVVFEQDGARVVVDESSFALLSGATIDFEDEVRAHTQAYTGDRAEVERLQPDIPGQTYMAEHSAFWTSLRPNRGAAAV